MVIVQHSDSMIYDFKESSIDDWNVVNDGVMGGLSKGNFSMDDDKHAVFEGFVTTANNGGFTSVQYAFKKRDVSKFSAIKLNVKGDGKTYQFRIKTQGEDSHSYVQDFKTSGEWESITIPFKQFSPKFRGKALDMPNYAGKNMEEVSILIGNGKNESFKLEIEKISTE